MLGYEIGCLPWEIWARIHPGGEHYKDSQGHLRGQKLLRMPPAEGEWLGQGTGTGHNPELDKQEAVLPHGLCLTRHQAPALLDCCPDSSDGELWCWISLFVLKLWPWSFIPALVTLTKTPVVLGIISEISSWTFPHTVLRKGQGRGFKNQVTINLIYGLTTF